MSKILKIIIYPNPILMKKSTEIKKSEMNSDKIQNLCSDLIKTMGKNNGVGIAAPQIGKNIKLIVINVKDGIFCMMNPKITKKSWAKEWDEEGCLSVPETYGKVKRHKKIRCIYFDKKGARIKIEAEGLMARIIQHEIDHLNGILFISKAKEIKKIKSK